MKYVKVFEEYRHFKFKCDYNLNPSCGNTTRNFKDPNEPFFNIPKKKYKKEIENKIKKYKPLLIKYSELIENESNIKNIYHSEEKNQIELTDGTILTVNFSKDMNDEPIKTLTINDDNIPGMLYNDSRRIYDELKYLIIKIDNIIKKKYDEEYIYQENLIKKYFKKLKDKSNIKKYSKENYKLLLKDRTVLKVRETEDSGGTYYDLWLNDLLLTPDIETLDYYKNTNTLTYKLIVKIMDIIDKRRKKDSWDSY
jgi:hypothetical protein